MTTSLTYQPIGSLSRQDWIEAPETQTLFAALQADGSEVRFVGGCVRDALAHKPVKDIDIATPDTPEKVIALLEKANIKSIPTGIKHGTITAIVGRQKFEVTTLRRDVETDGRHATVEFTDDWQEDAGRRDFTINAMSATLNRDVYDYFDGVSDLAHGRVYFIGVAKDRIKEDALRILRYFRFFGSHGLPPAYKEGIVACRALASTLKLLSGERIRDELLKILMCSDPADLINRMQTIGVLEQILPEAGNIDPLRILAWLETKALPDGMAAPDPIRRLAAILGADEEGVTTVSNRLRLSGEQKFRLSELCHPTVTLDPEKSTAEQKSIIRRFGTLQIHDHILISWAKEAGENPHLSSDRKRAWVSTLELCKNWDIPELPIYGRHITGLGVSPGPRIGELLGQAEDWWEDGDYKANLDQCREYVKSLLETGDIKP